MSELERIEVEHKGFSLQVEREETLGGWESAFMTVVRQSDGWFLMDEFTEGTDSLDTLIDCMKFRVDDYIEHPEDYQACELVTEEEAT